MSRDRWASGALAWWRVRDPLLTPVQPVELPVEIVAATPKGAVVKVVRAAFNDPDRPPGYQTAVSLRRLRPRVIPASRSSEPAK